MSSLHSYVHLSVEGNQEPEQVTSSNILETPHGPVTYLGTIDPSPLTSFRDISPNPKKSSKQT